MKIAEFELEKWLNPRIEGCKYNLGSSCVKAIGVDELLELSGEDKDEFYTAIKNLELHYGDFTGLYRMKKAICSLYLDIAPEMILTAHGGTGANAMAILGLVEKNSNVVALTPNYQQHYSIPETIGAEVRTLHLKKEDGYLPNIEELKKLVDKNTAMITLSNPNNPTGVAIEEEMMREIVSIAESVGAYILSDEIYRGLTTQYLPSIVDLYSKGISTASMSKVFSMAGSRVGWLVTKDREALEILENWRSYLFICEGVIDELLSAICIENKEKIFSRNRSIVDANKKILDSWLKTQPRLDLRGNGSASIAFINFDYDLTSREFGIKAYEEGGVLVCHGGCFDEEKSFRLGYGWDEEGSMKASLNALGEFLSSLERGNL